MRDGKIRTRADYYARKVFSKLVDSLSLEGRDHQEYLEFQLKRLEDMSLHYAAAASNPELPPSHRARNRDLLMSARGLVNGIKFSLALENFKGEDLMKIEGLDQLKKTK